MGAWGSGIFENDEASDFLASLDDALPQTLRLTLEPVTLVEEELYVEAIFASEALAAAEVVAAMRGKPGPSIERPEVMGWAEAHGDWLDGDLIRTAASAVRRTRANGELRDLWSESDEFEAWLACLDDLLARLT